MLPQTLSMPTDAAPATALTLAGPEEEQDGPMTDEEAQRILAGSCDRKHRYETWAHASSDARLVLSTAGQQVTAYRCPFGAHRGGQHWHVGHPPTHAHTLRLALAIRWLAQHPDSGA